MLSTRYRYHRLLAEKEQAEAIKRKAGKGGDNESNDDDDWVSHFLEVSFTYVHNYVLGHILYSRTPRQWRD